MGENMMLYTKGRTTTATLDSATGLVALTYGMSGDKVTFDPLKATFSDDKNFVGYSYLAYNEPGSVLQTRVNISDGEGDMIIDRAKGVLAKLNADKKPVRDSDPGAKARRLLRAQRERRALGGPQPA